ncbi:MAG: hypothetical protein IPK64_10695 [bacterium]|nr:hypothetical protein [bacterium]
MIATNKRPRGRRWAAAVTPIVGLLLVVVLAAPALAYKEVSNPVFDGAYNPNGVFIQDGSYVMNVGEVQINITNWGLIGSTYSSTRPWSDAPSCQWPAGSGNEYLWAAGLWVGGVVLGERLVSSGGAGSEIYPLPEVEHTIYEAMGGRIMRPAGNTAASGKRLPDPQPDDDDDDLVDEEVIDGFDDDGDGLVDEDFAQIGNQMMVLTNYDNTRLAREIFADHTPMNLKIVQTTFQWENDLVDDFVGFDYAITNEGVTNIEKVYIGFFADSDIGPRGVAGAAEDDMAGSWPEEHGSVGLVRGSDGEFAPVQVGYMYDASESDLLDGFFGIVFLGHDVDPTGARAPTNVGMRTFQSFSGGSSFEQGGDPSNDDEAYQLLSAVRDEWDNDTVTGKQGDFRFLVSAGPFANLPAGETLNFQVAMVVGSGLTGLLQNCAEAWLTYNGIWIDQIVSVDLVEGGTLNPGQNGRETMLCREDFPENIYRNFRPDYMDTTCVNAEWLIGQPAVSDEDMFTYEVDGRTKTCAMFNMDNCFECARQLGDPCTPMDFIEERWTCNKPDSQNKNACTGVDGNETQINWLVGMAPPAPGLRLWPTDSRVHVFWDDKSEVTEDIRLGRIDFESYRIWRADNWDRPFGSSEENGPESSLWQMVAEFDVVNNYVNIRQTGNTTVRDTLPLGANTGLDGLMYTPRVLTDARYDGLAEAMQSVVDADTGGFLRSRPTLRLPDSTPDPRYEVLLPWESNPAVLDTFFAAAARPAGEDVVGKDATRYYEYIDREVHNGFLYFYSVTATDHALTRENSDAPLQVTGPGLSGDPGSSFGNTTPGASAQSAEERERFGVNIYVYPNPATRDALAEYQQMLPNGEDPTGVRVTFTNLPMSLNTISIYTVSGDLVQTISHDGTTGSGQVSWNLMSRNLQEVVSGVYLYAVQSVDERFEDFIGKFVVIR